VRARLCVIFAVLVTLQCASSHQYAPCALESDCSAGQTCVHDRIGSYCAVACDVQVDAGHDPRCPPGFTCWAGEKHLEGNVCREGRDPSYNQLMLERYLRRLDGGLGTADGGYFFLVVDGGEILDHRIVYPPRAEAPSDR
jgi:hypothetical protein